MRIPAGSATILMAVAFVGLPIPAPGSAQTVVVSDGCVSCHLEQEEDRLSLPADSFGVDVHAAQGFDCLSCHGPEVAGVAPSAFLAAPVRREIPALCGRCHSDAEFMREYDPGLRVDQVSEYLTSGHGRRLFEDDDPDVATCVDCHTPHRTRPPNDPESSVYVLQVAGTCGRCHDDQELMESRGAPTGQFDAFLESRHGILLTEEGDLTAPTCNDCHGNHGAAPPGVGAVHRVCGECHAVMADLFVEGGHQDWFEDEALPGCVVCHGNHAIRAPDDSFLVTATDSVCSRCHGPGEEEGRQLLVMLALIDSLETEFAHSLEVLHQAENLGMEVSQALFELDAVNTSLTKARAAIHAFAAGPVEEEVDAGLALTSAGTERGFEALDEHRYRRVGLAVSSTIILVLIIGLLVKIRQLGRPGADEQPLSG